MDKSRPLASPSGTLSGRIKDATRYQISICFAECTQVAHQWGSRLSSTQFFLGPYLWPVEKWKLDYVHKGLHKDLNKHLRKCTPFHRHCYCSCRSLMVWLQLLCLRMPEKEPILWPLLNFPHARVCVCQCQHEYGYLHVQIGLRLRSILPSWDLWVRSTRSF